MTEILSPGVKHREKPDLGPKMFGISGDRPQRLGGRVEQDIIDHFGVLEGDGCNLVRHGEHNMEILGIEQLGATVLNLPMIGKLLGHRCVQSTARYAHLDDAHLLDAAEEIGRAIERALVGGR